MIEYMKAWQCIGCGKLDGPQDCIGICQDRKVELVLDGGSLMIEWREEDGHVLMTGPTAMPFRGRLDLDKL